MHVGYLYDILNNLDLAEYFITSKANRVKSQNEDEITIKVSKVSGKKCPRCWKILEKNTKLYNKVKRMIDKTGVIQFKNEIFAITKVR